MGYISFWISFLSSVAGAICGIGGGVIIKPVLDLFRIDTVPAISFMSGCTVLCMSGYSVSKTMISGESQINFSIGTPLAFGAILGGMGGKGLFNWISSLFTDINRIGAVQGGCLFLVTLFTFLYTLFKKRVPSFHVHSKAACLLIGLSLGVLSSFLGIGGGPINLVVLYFFFSMGTKAAAQNSLYIILFSQMASLLMAICTRTVPSFRWEILLQMCAGGVLGGIAGRKLNRRMNEKAVEYLFIALMLLILCISAYNTWQYAT